MFKRIASAAVAAFATTISVTALAPAAHAAPSVLHPSTQVDLDRTDGEGSSCTLGFLFDGADGRARGLISKHCTNIGQSVYTSEGRIPVGVVVAQGLVDDIALIDIVSPLPVDDEIPGLGHVSGVITPEELNRTRPLLCKVGVTTGTSCGPMVIDANNYDLVFHGESTSGDSGSPVYAVKPNGEVLAAGILSGGADDYPGATVAVPISPYMEQWNLTAN